MKNIAIIIIIFFTTINANHAQDCVDIDTKSVVSYLNQKIKPSLDLKLDKEDGFLAINRKRQNFSVPVVNYKWSRISRNWTYHFQDVRRTDSNFFYDSRKNKFVLDIKFEDYGPEIKGRCEGCPFSKDKRAPDVEWNEHHILRIFLDPVVYQNSISLKVNNVEFIGGFRANGFGRMIPTLLGNITQNLKTEMKKLFSNGQTQRLFNDALKPLLNKHNMGRIRNVTLASSSIRACQ